MWMIENANCISSELEVVGGELEGGELDGKRNHLSGTFQPQEFYKNNTIKITS